MMIAAGDSQNGNYVLDALPRRAGTPGVLPSTMAAGELQECAKGLREKGIVFALVQKSAQREQKERRTGGFGGGVS